MKRTSLLVCLCLTVGLIFSTVASFAENLELLSIYPKDKYHGLMPNNIAIKMHFSENMSSAEAEKANAKAFKIVDSKGREIPYTTLQNPSRYPNDIWLQITKNLKPEGIYHLTISGDLISSKGNTLGAPIVTEFGVRNTSADTSGYMVLMLLMVVGMIGFTVWDTRHKMKKEEESKGKSGEAKVDPYKEARRTGKPVEEIIAEQEKQKARNAKRRAAEEAAEAELAAREEKKAKAKAKTGVRRVKQRRSIKAAGAAIPAAVSRKRIAREEARKRAAEAERARRAKAGQPQKKGSKQQQRKKK